MEVGMVRQIDIDQEMRAAYLDYAMSVIVSRALPDARDGLKPVHRRILYAMYDMGLRPAGPYRKSARIVGEVLGKYHPHGDAAVYESMVRMAQDFAMRYPLVDGQGNFGSVDGDAAAAMRYTEARIWELGLGLLADIDKDTVDFADNFDASLVEPAVLPASFPNLIVNGSSGIAVGMSTSIPPHNMGEICDALIFMLNSWTKLNNVGLPELMQFIKGPDFPTGGLVFRYSDDGQTDNFAQAYGSGRGRVVVQARAHVEQLDRGRSRIVVTELPYQVNKTNLIERIAELAREDRLKGITDLRDESDRQGLRIVIDLTRNVDPDETLSDLYRLTPMRTTFSIIMLALVDGEPRLLPMKQALRVYVEHRFTVVRRRSEFDLERARERAHVLEGYLIALEHLDEVIDLIRRSRTVESAHENLRKHFKLSDIQAQAVLDMPLRRLAALERKKLEDEAKEKHQLIRYLERLLADPKMLRDVVRQEISDVKAQYSDARRSLIIEGAAGSAAVSVTELMPDESTWVVVTDQGLLSQIPGETPPKVTGDVKDPPRLMLSSGAGDILYLFTSDGTAVSVPVHQIPQTDDFQNGIPAGSIASLEPDQMVVAGLPRMSSQERGYLTLASVGGMIKRIAVEDLPGLSAHGFRVMTLSGDALGWALWTSGNDEIIMVSAEGMAIRFKEDTVPRLKTLDATGVKGIKLGGRHDRVVGISLFEPRSNLWVITQKGLAKSTPLSEYPVQGRYGQGVITMKFRDRDDALAAATVGLMDESIVVLTSKRRPKYMRIGLAPRTGRATSGEAVIALSGSEVVTGVVPISQREAAETD